MEVPDISIATVAEHRASMKQYNTNDMTAYEQGTGARLIHSHFVNEKKKQELSKNKEKKILEAAAARVSKLKRSKSAPTPNSGVHASESPLNAGTCVFFIQVIDSLPQLIISRSKLSWS